MKKKLLNFLLTGFVILYSLTLINAATHGVSCQPSQPIENSITPSVVPQAMDYPLTLSGVPSGEGTYQQLISLNPVTYGISVSGGNVLFYDQSNGTELYAWLQAINSTSASYWIRNYDSSSTIVMQVVSGANYFNATGYLGEAPQLSPTYAQYDNGKYVFLYYYNFVNSLGNLTLIGNSNSYFFNNGLNYSSNATATLSATLITPFTLNWIYYTEIENVKISGYTNGMGSGGVMFAGERNSVNSSAYQSYLEAYSSGLDMSNYNGGYNGIPFASANSNYFNIEWGSLPNSSAYLRYHGKITYNNKGTEPNNINPLNWYTYKGYFLYIHYFAISNIPMPLMPVFTFGSVEPLYAVSFSESGLPLGTDWSITLNSITKFSYNSVITFYEQNGSSTYIIHSIWGYRTANYVGQITVNGNLINQTIVWSVILYPVTIIGLGIPNGIYWSVTLKGITLNHVIVYITHSSRNSTITFNVPDGNYTYDIHLPIGYITSTTGETLNVSGFPVSSFVIVKQASTGSTKVNYLIYVIVAAVIVISTVGAVIALSRKKK